MKRRCLVVMALLALPQVAPANLFDRPQHYEVLKLDKDGAKGWSAALTKAAQVGAIFNQNEAMAVEITLTNPGKADMAGQFTLELHQIGLEVIPGGIGQASLQATIRPLGLVGKVNLPVTALKPGGNALPVEALPVPPTRNGVFALVVDGGPLGRQIAGTVMRGFAHPDKAMRNSPVLMVVQDWGAIPAFSRMGVRWLRTDSWPGWGHAQSKIDGPFNWTDIDAKMKVLADNHQSIVTNMYGAPEGTVPAECRAAYNLAVHEPKFDAGFSEFVFELVKRYNRNGTGPLQVIDWQNEPWEGGGISGWKSDAIRYRQGYKAIFEGAKRASPNDPATGKPRILVGGASSIMNTIDKFFGDGSDAWVKFFDVLTDHYVLPSACFGPAWGKSRGLVSLESETWLGHSENAEAIVISQFLAAGQWKVTPNHNAYMTWDHGMKWQPTPVAGGLSAALHFIGERALERVVFTDHLPWVFQYGKGSDAVFMLCGDERLTETDTDPVYKQIKVDGRLVIPNKDEAIKAFDAFGNPVATVNGELSLPLRYEAFWLTMPGGDAADVEKRLAAGVMAGVTPVELILNDFAAPLKSGGMLPLTVHNVLTMPVQGTVTVKTTDGLVLAKDRYDVSLKPGQRATVPVTLGECTPNAGNGYGVEVSFDSPQGTASCREVVRVACATFGSPTIDGSLEDWKDTLPITVIGSAQKLDSTLATWYIHKLDELKTADPKGAVAEFRTMWDEKNLYLAARVRTGKFEPILRQSTRKDDDSFGTGAMSYTWVKNPWDAKVCPFMGDSLQVGLGFGIGDPTLTPVCPVPKGFLAEPDTDYEYALYATQDGGAECWRLLVPGMPRIHDLARCLRPTDPAIKPMMPEGSRVVVKREGDTTIYEAAIPWSELKKFAPKAGAQFDLAFRFGAQGIDRGRGRSATKDNGLTLHPYFVRTPSNALHWGLVR